MTQKKRDRKTERERERERERGERGDGRGISVLPHRLTPTWNRTVYRFSWKHRHGLNISIKLSAATRTRRWMMPLRRGRCGGGRGCKLSVCVAARRSHRLEDWWHKLILKRNRLSITYLLKRFDGYSASSADRFEPASSQCSVVKLKTSKLRGTAKKLVARWSFQEIFCSWGWQESMEIRRSKNATSHEKWTVLFLSGNGVVGYM